MIVMICLAVGLVLFAALIIALSIRHQRQQPQNEKPSTSIVLLLSEPYALEESALRHAFEKAFGGDFSVNVDGRIVLPVIERAQYMVWAQDSAFILHNVPGSYFQDPHAVAQSIQDDEVLAENIRTHSAWLSFDMLSSEKPLQEQYDLIGPVLSELAPAQTIALFVVEKEVLIRFDAERRAQLKGPNVLEQLGFA